MSENDPNRPLLAAAEQAAVRAADLTGKLLGYARRNQLVFAPVDPAEAFGEVVGFLRRTLDPRIRLAVKVAPGCDSVQADPTLLTQALMNLCLNARDAMPEGGTLSAHRRIDRRNGGRGQPLSRRSDSRAITCGSSMADTGTGMTDAGEGAHLRAVLHHEGDRQGNRARIADGSGDRQATPRLDHLRFRSGRGYAPRPLLPAREPGDRVGHAVRAPFGTCRRRRRPRRNRSE